MKKNSDKKTGRKTWKKDPHTGGPEKKRSEKEPYSDKPLPGEYPPKEDIMDRRNEMHKIPIDPQNFSRSSPVNRTENEPANEAPSFRRSRNVKNNNAPKRSDLTKEDYEALGPRDLSLDGGDDEQLKHRVWPVDFGARDLDVPSADDERPDAMEQSDEENDHYSLGGDDKENLEEDPTRTFG